MRKLPRALTLLTLLGCLAGSGALALSAAAAPVAPTALTGSATRVGPSTATFRGTVNPNGTATTYVFKYGPTTGYGFQTPPLSAGAGTAAVAAAYPVGGLQPGTTYHYELVATSTGGTTPGGDRTVTTTQAPSVATGAATGIGSGSVTLNGTVNPHGHSAHFMFQFGTTPYYGLETAPGSAGAGTGSVAVHQALTALGSHTTYHYRIVGFSSQGTTYGADHTFTTTPGAASSHLGLLGRMGFVSPRGGFVGFVLGCFGGQTRCTGRLTLTRGRTTLASRNFSLGPNSGGFQNVKLSSGAERNLFRGYRGPVAVRLNVLTTTGQRLSQILHLARWR